MKRFGLVAIAIFGSACVRQKDDGSLSQAEARNAGDSLAAGVEDSAKGFGRVSDGTTLDQPCVTMSGDTADPDADSIPNNAKLTYNCTGMLLGLTATVTGTMGVVDNQPAAATWAFTGMSDLHGSLTGGGTASIVRDVDGVIVASQLSALGPYKLQRMLDVVTVFTGERGATTTVTEDNDWSVVFTPVASWTPGGVIVTGNLAVTGTWNVTVENKVAMATLSTPAALVIDPACASLVKGGSLIATYDDDNGRSHDIDVTWTGCGTRTVTQTIGALTTD
jgi:hypothetical protein